MKIEEKITEMKLDEKVNVGYYDCQLDHYCPYSLILFSKENYNPLKTNQKLYWAPAGMKFFNQYIFDGGIREENAPDIQKIETEIITATKNYPIGVILSSWERKYYNVYFHGGQVAGAEKDVDLNTLMELVLGEYENDGQ